MGTNIDECMKTVQAQKWANILQDRQESEKSNVAYCAEHGINIKTYYYWQTKLRWQATGMLNVSSSCETFASRKPSDCPGEFFREYRFRNHLPKMWIFH
jgi:hypothetical protein